MSDHRRGLGVEALRDPHLYLLALTSAVLAAAAALLTVGFVELLEAVHETLWVDLPEALGAGPSAAWFVVTMAALGGVLVGFARSRMGEHPPSLSEALAGLRRERGFDYRHLPQGVVISLLGLGFGAALGPEAVLVALVGGLGTWIAQRIESGAAGRHAMVYVGSAAVLGGLTGSPGAATVPLGEGPADRPGRLWLVVPGAVAALVAAWVFDALSSGGGYFSYDYPAYDFAAGDLVWTVPLAALGVAVTLCYLVAARFTASVGRRLDAHPVAQSLAGGLVLGALAAVSPLVLFSGHSGIQTLIDDPTATVGFLLGIAALKLVATTTLLGTRWKGGRFFPVMFAAAAVGLAAAEVLSGPVETPAIAVVMTAAVAALIAQPVAGPLVMVFVFPLEVAPLVVVGGGLAGWAGAHLQARLPALADEPGGAAHAEGL